MTKIITSAKLLENQTQEWNERHLRVGFVPTMGCLHEGHLSLIRQARKENDVVVVSIFVNPLQFGPREDLSAYPRPFERDVELCRELGVDTLFHPSPKEFTPRGMATHIQGGPLTKMYCGKTRPIHFGGVLTIVSILFDLVRPTRAYFGEKDFQQLFLIKQMCRDLHKPVEIVAMPIVREASGLAMSSRNTYLSDAERSHATCLVRAIRATISEADQGNLSRHRLVAAASELISSTPGMHLDYVHLVSPKTLLPIGDLLTVPTRILIAAYVGDARKVRLIDNGPISLPAR